MKHTITIDDAYTKVEKMAVKLDLLELRRVAKEAETDGREVELSDMSGKLEAIKSLSTNPLLNSACVARMLCGDSGCTCTHCYAGLITLTRDALSLRLARNTGRLRSHLLAEAEIPRWPTVLGRIEAFGDVENAIVARNYIRVIKANPRTMFGIWTKNVDIWTEAFNLDGKPENCAFIISSIYNNQPVDIPADAADYVDHRFTVYDSKYIRENTVNVNCDGKKCIECQVCYQRGTTFDISEKLK